MVMMFVYSTQILGQLGPKYKGSAAVEGLVHQCQEYLATSDQALFIPQNAFMPAPGGLLLSSINLRLFIMGMLMIRFCVYVCVCMCVCVHMCVCVCVCMHVCVCACVCVCVCVCVSVC